MIRVKKVYFSTYYYKISTLLGFPYIISISSMYMVGVFVHTYFILPVVVPLYVCANVFFMKPVLGKIREYVILIFAMYYMNVLSQSSDA
jgi:hypothetical protein